MLLTYLPLAAFVIASISLYRSTKSNKKTSAENQELLAQNKELSKELQQLRETKYIGTFPSYFDHVIELVTKAKEDIKIVTPLLATGNLTIRDKWNRYQSALLASEVNGVKVDFTVYDKSRRTEYIIEKFGDEYELKKDKLGNPPQLRACWEIL